jgi:quercetin dioxygenase-like cupin family protein
MMTKNNVLPAVFTDQEISSSVLMKSENVSVTRIILRKNAKIAEHVSKTNAMLLILEGYIIFKTDIETELMKNDYVNFSANEKHEIFAVVDSVLLLIR